MPYLVSGMNFVQNFATVIWTFSYQFIVITIIIIIITTFTMHHSISVPLYNQNFPFL